MSLSFKMMLPLKIGILSATVLCVAMVLKLYLPVVTELAYSDLPSIWTVVMMWLRPPYLYVVINCIIISIVASSKLHNKVSVDSPPENLAVPSAVVYSSEKEFPAVVYGGEKEYPAEAYSSEKEFPVVVYDGEKEYPVVVYDGEKEYPAVYAGEKEYPAETYGGEKEYVAVVYDGEKEYPAVYGDEKEYLAVVYDGEKEYPAVYGGEKEFPVAEVQAEYVYKDVFPEVEEKVMTSVLDLEVEDKRMMTIFNADVEDVRIYDDDVAVSKPLQTPKRIWGQFPVSIYEKPPVSVRTGHRRAAKSFSEGGRALGVSKSKRQETLETTWKTITEGRPMPLTRHLRKPDTWETRGQHLPQDPDPKMTKSETFNASGDCQVSPMKLRKEPSGSWKLKKDPSLSQDELNKRVEAFINKFNEDMRLQRQESLNQYMEMINRGAH